MKRPILRTTLAILGTVIAHVALWGGHYAHEQWGDTWMGFPITVTAFLWVIIGWVVAFGATYPFD